MLIGYRRGQGSIVLRVKLLNALVSTGAGITGLTFSSSGLIIGTIADNEAATTRYRASSSEVEDVTTLGTYAAPTSGKCRFKEVDSTNHRGIYEIQLADARFAVSSAKSLLVSIAGAAGAAECDIVIPLRDLDPYDAVRAGLTALPNAAAETAGGLYTRGTGAGQIAQEDNGQISVNVKAWLRTTASTPTVAGVPNVNAKTWNDLATVDLPLAPTTAGRKLDVSTGGEAGLDWANVGSPTTTVGLSGTTIKAVTDAGSDSTGVTALLARLTAARAGYLDNLSAGAVALEASLQGLITTVGAAGAGLTALATAVWAVGTRTLTAFGFHVQLATAQDQYAPAVAGDPMTLTAAYNAAKTAAQSGDIPSSVENAAALLAAAAASPIDANVAKVNDVNIIGTGTSGDLFRVA